MQAVAFLWYRRDRCRGVTRELIENEGYIPGIRRSGPARVRLSFAHVGVRNEPRWSQLQEIRAVIHASRCRDIRPR